MVRLYNLFGEIYKNTHNFNKNNILQNFLQILYVSYGIILLILCTRKIFERIKNFMKRNFKTFVSTFIIGIILGISTMVIFAGTASSSTGYYGPFLGYYYKNYATITVDGNGQNATTTVSNDGSGYIPTGYMGAQARLYKNDALYKYSTMGYSSAPVISFFATTGWSSGGSGTYYSYGMTAAYNGNGYTNYYTFISPSQNQ
jgi:hypothetical protein